MHKFNRVLSIGLLTATAIATLPDLLTQIAIAQTSSRQQLSGWQMAQNNPPEPPVSESPGGKRTGKFCAIAPRPFDTSTEVWSDRPLFKWQGKAGEIEVRLQGSEKPLWSQTVPLKTRSVMYDGEALQPGQTYSWVIFDLEDKLVAETPFKAMETQKRDRIKTQLQALEGELKAKGASTDEIALNRAKYFAQQQLWSDAWREVSSVENPSAALNEFVQTIPPADCTKKSEQNSSPAP